MLLLLLLAVFILIFSLREKNSEQWISYNYPEINDKIIEEIQEGHHTDYFDSFAILYGFLDKCYPEYDKSAEIISEKGNEIIYSIILLNADETIMLEVKLQQEKIEGTDYEVWVISGYKII